MRGYKSTEGSLAVAGRWRPERHWLDRAGRVIGLAWIVTVPLVWGWYFFAS